MHTHQALILQLVLWVLFIFLGRRSAVFPAISVLILVNIFHFVLSVYIIKHRRLTVKTVVVYAVLLRIVSSAGQPFLENDYYRYLWDGIVTAQGLNALIISPDEVISFDTEPKHADSDRADSIRVRRGLLSEDSLEELLLQVNYGESPSIYGPVAQVFLALQTIPWQILRACDPETEIPLQWRLYGLQIFLFGLEFVAALIFYRLVKDTSNPAGLLFLFICSPLLLKEIGNSLHLDILPVALVLGAWLALQTNKPAAAGSLLGLACCAKPYPLVLFPLFWIFFRRRWRFSVIFCSTVIACYFPYLLSGGAEIWLGHRYFAHLWTINDFFTGLVREFFYHGLDAGTYRVDLDQIGTLAVSRVQLYSRVVGLAAFVVCSLFIVLKRRHCIAQMNVLLRTVADILFLTYVFSAVQNPWYLIWGLPFFILARQTAYLFFVALCQCYLFNFVYEATPHLLHPLQWWVPAPYLLLGVFITVRRVWVKLFYNNEKFIF